MKRKTSLLSFLFIALCFFTECSEGPSARAPIDNDIIFKFVEGYRDSTGECEPEIMLYMETDRWYGCCNYSIESEISLLGNEITIKLLGIYMPGVCLTAFGPASSREFFSLPDGIYLINFIHGFSMDKYVLNVSDSCLEIFNRVVTFTRPEFYAYWRYPPNSFVYLCGTKTETSWICQDFLNTLLGEVNLQEFFFLDYGEICYPRSSMGHYYDMPARYFLYESDENFDRAGEVLEAYTHAVIDQYSGVGISLWNWKHEEYASWLFDWPLSFSPILFRRP